MKPFYPILALVLLTASQATYATHLRAADIIVTKEDCASLRYQVTLRVYVNTSSNTPVGGFSPDDGHLSFGDGTIVIVPHTQVIRRPDLGIGIGIAEVTFTHTYLRGGTYKINYFERDRSSGIVNIAASYDVPYSTYVQINATAGECNAFPALAVAPLDRACRGVTFFHNAGATDSDGDSISYALTVPSRNSASFVDGYVHPADRRFYTNFSQANEAGTGEPVFGINAETGLITWDAPGLQGEYNIAFKVLEWRRHPVSGEFSLISETIRDMQIVVEDCANDRPRLTVPKNLCVEAGSVISRRITGSDPDGHPVRLEVFSAILEGEPESFPASYSPVMTTFAASPAEIDFNWATQCSHVRDQSYQVVFKITDSPPSGPNLVTFETWNIRVIAPTPKWRAISPDLVSREADLEWEPYTCRNAEKIQVWRKVGSNPFPRDECTTGLSPYKGYELIAELPPGDTTFRDDNRGRHLVVAAQYCYRLVAVFPNPAGGKSYVSLEYCMDPILADAPVITHVSVMTTDQTNGGVVVKWLEPFEISKEQYPGPYEYEVYRSIGVPEDQDAINVSGRLQNLSINEFIDQGVNTTDSVFHYRVVLYSRTAHDNTFHPIDTSAVASTIRLYVEPGDGTIRITWDAVVPWSNVADQDPWHRIYRGVYGDEEHGLVLIDSADVTDEGFFDEDRGAANRPLEDDVRYCYAVVAKGTYGNPAIPLQLNRSQMVCTYTANDLPPCKPVLHVDKTDCKEFLATRSCETADYQNMLTWQFESTEGCRTDVISFNVYTVEVGKDTLIVAENIQNNYVVDAGLLSFARCYQVRAIGHDGRLGELSDPDCNENCPYFSLPNVFTPNGDRCNDLFGVYDPGSASVNPDCLPFETTCASFVRRITFRVLNRWGREVYFYQSEGPDAAHINWNGEDAQGTELDTGIYFYVANVAFDMRDPAQRERKYKGWIHIIR